MRILRGGTVTIISFKLWGNGTYQAEEGMTWEQWVNSSYNTIDASIYDNRIWLFEKRNICYKYVQSSSCFPNRFIKSRVDENNMILQPLSQFYNSNEWRCKMKGLFRRNYSFEIRAEKKGGS